MQLSQLENKMLQFLNSDFKEFTKQDQQTVDDTEDILEIQEKQEIQEIQENLQNTQNSQRQTRVRSYDDKQCNRPLNALFQQLLQHKALPKKTQKRQQMKIDPKEINLSLNLTTCVQESQLVKRLMEKNDWKKAHNFEGDILWSGPDNVQQAKQFTFDFAMVFLNQTISRIPGMKLAATKKETTNIMKKMSDYFPSIYNFYPRTYTLPDDLPEFMGMHQNEPKTYIAKPDKGTQGQGIFLVRNLDDIFVNGVREAHYCKKNYIVQEYISNPLLLDGKKFDFRLYVLITSLNPLVAYLNEEGLARLCTMDYENVSEENINQQYMHLTNYSLNKNSPTYVAPPNEFQKVNSGTKRTYTSAKKTLSQMGIDVPKLKLRVEQTIVRFLYGIAPFLLNSMKEVYQDKWQQAKCFHVVGFDILIDNDLKPWVIEINANPSLEIFHTTTVQNVKRSELSPLDAFVKSKVLEDAFIISTKSVEEQITQIGRGKYLNSYKMIVDGVSPIENLDMFQRVVDLYSNLCGLRYGNLNQTRFSRLSNNPFLTNELLLKSDYDLIYKKVLFKSLQQDMSLVAFIEAIEQIAERLLKKKTLNYSIQKAVNWIVNTAKIQRPQTAKRC